MHIKSALLVLLVLASAQAKYEDQFGKVYDWKREGFGQTVTTVFSSQTIFLLSKTSFSLIDYVGRVRTSVDVDYSDYAIDVKGEKIYLLSLDRLQVFEFSTATGQFVQTLNTDKGPLSKVRFLNGRLYLIYQSAVDVGQNGESFKTLTRKYKENIAVIDANPEFVLLNKKGKLCIEKLGADAKKEKDAPSVCTKTGTEEYLYPSDKGFWFTDRASLRLIHLSQEGLSEASIAYNTFSPVKISGISTTVALREAGTTDLYAFTAGQVSRADTIEKTCSSDEGVYFGTANTNANFLGLVCFRTDLKTQNLLVVTKEIVDGKVRKSHEINTLHYQVKNGEIDKVWVHKTTNNGHLVLTSAMGGHLTMFGEQGKTQWEKSTELSNIAEVLVAEYPSDEDAEGEVPRYEAYGKNFIGAFLYRVATDANNLVHFFSSLVKRLTQFSLTDIIDRIKGKGSIGLEDVNYYNKYGLRKNLIFLTNSQKFVSVDSLSGKEQWTLALKPGQKALKALVNGHNNIDLIYTEGGKKKRTEISSLDGTFVSEDVAVDQKASIFLEGEEDQAPLEIGPQADYIKNAQHEYVFYKVGRERGVIGYRHSNGKFDEVWNYQLEPGQEIIDYSYHLKGDNQFLSRASKGSTVTLPEEEALYFKVIDPNNVALLIKQTINTKQTLVLSIVNTLRGKVLGTYYNADVDFTQPIGFIYDDNGIFLTYFNPRVSGFELWSIELYKLKIETSFYEMLQKYVLKVKKEEELDYNREVSQYIILDKKYGLNVGLKSLSAVNTRYGLTRRNLIGITTSNDIISIDRILISARRTEEENIKKGKGKLSYHSMVYPPYQYALPISNLATLNAKWRLSGIEKVKVIDTKFESTSLVVAYGKDLFVTKIQPDNTFDLLNDDFNYTLLGVVTVAITVLVIVLRRLAVKSEAKKRYFMS